MGQDKIMANNKNNNNKANSPEELAKMSGEENIMGAPRYSPPIIRLQGKEGIFQKITKDNEGETQTEDLPKTIEITTLKFRRTLTRFVTEKGKLKESYFTSEHNSSNDEITIFVRNKEGEIKLIDSGNAKKMKEKHNLKMVQIIYVLVDNEIFKLNVKGSSLSALYEFRIEAKKTGKHFHELLLKIGMTKFTSPLGDYYAMDFSIKKELTKKEIEIVGEKIKEISDKLNEIDSYYKDREGKEEGEFVAEGIEKQFKKDDEEKAKREKAGFDDGEMDDGGIDEEEIDVNKINFA